MSEFKLPTETVTLPSQGLLYSKESPLSKGEIEMKYMTAKEEDILSNSKFISDGTVIDRVLKSLMVTKFNWDDLLIGDKNAIMVAARILGYGKDYTFKYNGVQETVDLTKIEDKKINKKLYSDGKNEFTFTLPHSENTITYQLLTGRDEKKVTNELKGLKKINRDSSPEATTRLKQMILSVNGDDDKKVVRDFVDNYLLARDARAFREEVQNISPDVDLSFFPPGSDERVSIPVGINFFWPDAEISS